MAYNMDDSFKKGLAVGLSIGGITINQGGGSSSISELLSVDLGASVCKPKFIKDPRPTEIPFDKLGGAESANSRKSI